MTLVISRLRIGICLCLAAAALAGQEKQTDPPPGETPAAESVAPASAVDPKSYVIGPEDILAVRVWREPELSGQFPVRPDGKISLQLVNEIQAAGLTPEKLSGTIAEGLSKYMTRPEVSVAVLTVNSKKFYISGEVNRPGVFPLLNRTTILQALTNAGGFRDFANTKKIVVLRGSERFKFNYKDVIKGKKMEQNIQLENGDHIVVP
ncbi:MAG: polysaccharide biosynthesis/export family protein [Bryobacteraceae bacterium]